jgi:hypothetical protein
MPYKLGSMVGKHYFIYSVYIVFNCYSISSRATRRDYFQLTQIKEQLVTYISLLDIYV